MRLAHSAHSLLRLIAYSPLSNRPVQQYARLCVRAEGMARRSRPRSLALESDRGRSPSSTRGACGFDGASEKNTFDIKPATNGPNFVNYAYLQQGWEKKTKKRALVSIEMAEGKVPLAVLKLVLFPLLSCLFLEYFSNS